MEHETQFSLLKKLRFGPFFIVQFLGAFNDNAFKTALLALVTYSGLSYYGIDNESLINILAGLFIFPFFLFSATAGQLADKFAKSKLIRALKFTEILIMVLGGIGFYFHSIGLLTLTLFLLGSQAAFFGPVKYSILPQYLKETELVGGNGMVEMGTFLAILLGTLFSGTVLSFPHIASSTIIAVTILLAVLGWFASLYIPKVKASDPSLKINWNIFQQTWKTIGYARQDKQIFLSILGISWFWFHGAIIMAQIFNYTKVILQGDESVVTAILVFFSIGIGLGSTLCERLSDYKIETGLVPLGAFGLTLFGVLLYFLQPEAASHSMINLSHFLSQLHSWLILGAIALMGTFGGFYIVPLYAFVQYRSEPSHRSRIIAANNILNALGMSVASIFAVLAFQIGLTIPQLFLCLAFLNLAVSCFIFTIVPEFMMRFLVWVIVHSLYRIKKQHIEECIPETGPAVLVCNHVSFIDVLIIIACVRRPIRFVMDHNIYNLPVLNFIFRTAKTIPIAAAKEAPEIKEEAFAAIAHALKKGQLVGIFPEGAINRDGEMQAFRPGIERIIQETPVPVIPLALQGLWGTFFSRRYGKAMCSWPRRLWSRIGLAAGAPIPPQKVTANYLYQVISSLRGDRK